jgi:hypothetical protein
MFGSFTVVSGLKVNRKDTSAVCISPSPRPVELDCFDWKWENKGEYPKLRGFPLAAGMSQDLIWAQITEKLEKQICEAKGYHFNLVERKVLINQQFQGLWYVIFLWGGNNTQLEDLQNNCQNSPTCT